MLVKKKIQIDFADTRLKAVDHIQDIRVAAEYSGLNLFSRYNVRLQYPMPTDDDRVVVEVWIPEEIAGAFAIGNHLRGVSKYLLSRFKDRYQPYLVGKRLLNYTEVDNERKTEMGLQMTERMEAIVSFTRLLERSDDEALDKISQILSILKDSEEGEKYE